MHDCDTYFQCWASIYDPDHLCFRRTTYDDINGPGGTIYVVIFGPAGPLMHPDQISRYRPSNTFSLLIWMQLQALN